MRPNLPVIEAFARLAAAQEPVRLINDYRGIPVNYEATVEEVQKNAVLFRVHKYQCVCLELERYTYIQSPSLPSILKARVADLDIVATRVALGHFETASATIGRRKMIRVQPKEPVEVLINPQGNKIRGSLVDVSSSGIGIYLLSAYIKNPGLLRKGERIHLALQLPNEQGGSNLLRIPGTILYVNPEKGSYRLGIDSSPEAHVQSLISQYIAQRQAEIMRELRALYDKFYRLKQEGQNKSP
jgi:hypothetical protein